LFKRLTDASTNMTEDQLEQEAPADTQALHGGASGCRNRTLHQMFLLINLGERAGAGVPKIRSGWEQEGHGLRLFDSFEPFDQTVLEMTWSASNLAVSSEAAGTGSPIGSPISSPISSSKTEDRILQMLRDDPKYSARQLGDALGISKRAVLKQIDKLKQQGRLTRIGSAKGGHWEVLN
jgi:predicted HTH transcriptional regulator